MPGSIQLSKTELAALNLLIAAYSPPGPGGFIGDIMGGINQVLQATQQIAPVIQAAQNLFGGVGGPSSQQQLQNALGPLPAGVTVDQLIQLRQQATQSS